MEFFFPDLENSDNFLPPNQVRFESLTVDSYGDGRRVRVSLHITPFRVRPYIELAINDSAGEQLATASVVEPMTWKLELTMHLRKPYQEPVSGNFVLAARLFYPEMDDIDRREIPFEIVLEP